MNMTLAIVITVLAVISFSILDHAQDKKGMPLRPWSNGLTFWKNGLRSLRRISPTYGKMYVLPYLFLVSPALPTTSVFCVNGKIIFPFTYQI